MSTTPPDLNEISKFGIVPEDEFRHPWNAGDITWNESWFFDWYDDTGTNAGHCRIGLMPGQNRIWLWLYLYDGERWAAVEEPRMPIAALADDGLAFDSLGLTGTYETIAPLQKGKLSVSGFARIISGKDTGRIEPFSVTLDITATGAAHSHGKNTIKGHTDEKISTSRYEQAIAAHVVQKVGTVERRFAARGERDHSWGPRFWNMNWHFLVANGPDRRFMSTVVDVAGNTLRLGYLSRQDTISLTDVQYDLTYYDSTPEQAITGSFTLTAEDGTRLSGRIEPISGVAIDLSHALLPPQESIYRRTLVRCIPDDGSEPLTGWMEINRMPG